MGWSTPWRATLAMPANSRAIQSGAAQYTATDVQTISWAGQKKNQRSILWLLFCRTYPLRRPCYDSQFRIIKSIKKHI